MSRTQDNEECEYKVIDVIEKTKLFTLGKVYVRGKGSDYD